MDKNSMPAIKGLILLIGCALCGMCNYYVMGEKWSLLNVILYIMCCVSFIFIVAKPFKPFGLFEGENYDNVDDI